MSEVQAIYNCKSMPQRSAATTKTSPDVISSGEVVEPSVPVISEKGSKAIESVLLETSVLRVKVNAVALADGSLAKSDTSKQPLKQRMEEMVIKSDEEEKIFTETGVIVARLKKSLEAERKSKVEPHNKIVDEINAFYKKYSGPLDELKSIAERKIMDWRKEKARKAREAQERLDKAMAEKRSKELEEAAKQGSVAAPAFALQVSVAPPPANTTKSDTGSAIGRTVWTWKVTDESKIADEYWILDEKKINALVKSGVREIAGIQITEEQAVSFRG